MEKILLLEISELRYLEVTCPNPNKEKCGKTFVFDLLTSQTFPQVCPSRCGADWKQLSEDAKKWEEPFVAFDQFRKLLAEFQAKFRIQNQDARAED